MATAKLQRTRMASWVTRTELNGEGVETCLFEPACARTWRACVRWLRRRAGIRE